MDLGHNLVQHPFSNVFLCLPSKENWPRLFSLIFFFKYKIYIKIVISVHFCPFWYMCYYLHRSKDSKSPVYRIYRMKIFWTVSFVCSLNKSKINLAAGLPVDRRVICKHLEWTSVFCLPFFFLMNPNGKDRSRFECVGGVMMGPFIELPFWL